MKGLSVLLLAFAVQITFGRSLMIFNLPNPGFEHPLRSSDGDGWKVGEYGHTFVRDFEVKYSGAASLRVDSAAQPQSSGLNSQIPIEIIRENAFQLSGYVRTRSLDGGASLYVLIDREDGQRHYDFLEGRVATHNQSWRKLELLIPEIPDAVRAEIGLIVWGHGSAWLDDIRLVSIDTDVGLSREASEYLQKALDLMEEHSIVRGNIDWLAVRQSARDLASGSISTGDTYGAVEFVIHSLSDGHSRFIRPSDAQTLKSTGADDTGLGDLVLPTGHLLESRIGYVNVPTFRGFDGERTTAFADELQALIADLDSPDVCGWVVDLRKNSGGKRLSDVGRPWTFTRYW